MREMLGVYRQEEMNVRVGLGDQMSLSMGNVNKSNQPIGTSIISD